jgi:hypothetical protein
MTTFYLPFAVVLIFFTIWDFTESGKRSARIAIPFLQLTFIPIIIGQWLKNHICTVLIHSIISSNDIFKLARNQKICYDQ